MKDLASKKCTACRVGTPPLKGEALKAYRLEGWKVIQEHHIEKEFSFRDFKTALEFVNGIGKVAEQEGHHPDIFLTYGKVKVILWTHKIDGLSENDFILAAKCDQSFKSIT